MAQVFAKAQDLRQTKADLIHWGVHVRQLGLIPLGFHFHVLLYKFVLPIDELFVI